MNLFNFEGRLPSSKSILNRLLVLKYWQPDLNWSGDSVCDDVLHMKKAIFDISKGQTIIECGEAAAVFRFLVLLVSRLNGNFILKGSQSLFKRPHDELRNILGQFSVNLEIVGNEARIESQGWSWTSQVEVDVTQSSQFLSALILNSINLEKDLEIKMIGDLASTPYLELTISILEFFGVYLNTQNNLLFIPERQKIIPKNFAAEVDLSSAAAVLAMAATGGHAKIDLNGADLLKTEQADVAIVNILDLFGVSLNVNLEFIEVFKSKTLYPIEWSFFETPDLFPVVSALSALAVGKSVLRGAPHLRLKESDRIAGVKKILDTLGVKCEEFDDGLNIIGQKPDSSKVFNVSVENDHRLLMMVSILNAGGWHIKVDNIECVNKSFPEFKEIAKAYL